jgi:hypothetical protein
VGGASQRNEVSGASQGDEVSGASQGDEWVEHLREMSGWVISER